MTIMITIFNFRSAKRQLYLTNPKVNETPGTLHSYNVVTVEDQFKEFSNLKCTRAKAV